MPRICISCDKKSKKAASRSHSNVKSLRRQKINLQMVSGRLLCTRCLRSEAKVAA